MNKHRHAPTGPARKDDLHDDLQSRVVAEGVEMCGLEPRIGEWEQRVDHGMSRVLSTRNRPFMRCATVMTERSKVRVQMGIATRRGKWCISNTFSRWVMV